jgi:hypothetical protein
VPERCLDRHYPGCEYLHTAQNFGEALVGAYYVVPLCGFVNMGVPLRPALIWFFLVSYKKK